MSQSVTTTVNEEKARNRIKAPILYFLNKNFPVVSWDCMIDLQSGVAALIATEISEQYGYYIYLDDNEHVMQDKLNQAAHEVLERFQVKTRQDLLDMPRRIDGEAIGAANGER